MILSVSGLSFGVGVKNILNNVTFGIEEGDRLGIVGVNGSGKSTLLKLLCGEYSADEGSVYIAKNKSVQILHQDDAFNLIKNCSNAILEQMYGIFPELLEMEQKLAYLEKELEKESDERSIEKLSAEYARVNGEYIDRGGLYFKSKCKSLLTNLGFGEEYHALPIDSLSGGQRTRLALARILAREPDVIMLDEPTNHLDGDTLEWLEGYLASYKKTLIVVSHDRLFLDRVTNKTLDVENKTAVLYKVPYSGFVKEKEKTREAAEKKYELQQKEISRLEAFIENQRRWGREKNIIAAESRKKAIDRMEKVEKPPKDPGKIGFNIKSSGESGNDVLEVKNLTMGFSQKKLFENMSFLLKKNDRLFISGPNGCGKSTLIKILLEQIPPVSGTIEYGYNVTAGYYSQDNQGLEDSNTILEELWSAHPSLTQTEIRNALALFMFRGDDVEKTVSVLSGGERARLTLAKLVLSKMNLLILDEPTNHLDIDSREALERALENFDGTIIAVSHDRYFTKKLATRFIVLSDGRYEDFHGNYDDLANSRKNPQSQIKEEEKTTSSSKEAYLAKKQETQKIRKAERRLEAIAKEESELELELVNIDDELYGAAASDYMRAAELSDKKITVEDRLMQLYEEEESLNEFLSAAR